MSATGVSVDLEKVEAVMSWKRPNVNIRDMKFLGISWLLQEIREWAEVIRSGQDRRFSPMGHGLHGWGGPDHGVREIEDTWNTRDTGVGRKREDQLLLVRGRGRRLLLHTSFRTRARIEHE